MLTAKAIHEMYTMKHLQAKQWHEASAIVKRAYKLARAIEVEERSIVAIKCPTCCEMMSAYGFSDHECQGAGQ